MPFPSAALTSGQLDALRGTASVNPTWRGAQYLSLCPNSNVFVCRVNGTPTGTSFAEITFDTVTTGSYSDVKIGQTILVSRTNDRRVAFFVGRIRAAATGTLLKINETSAAILDNDYIWVIDDYRVYPKLARDVSGTHYKDWDKTFAQLPPVVVGVQTAYAGFTNASNKLRIAFDASSSYAATSGATISSYAWTFPGSASVISGATNTATVTMDFAESAGDWCSLLVTDSGGRTTTRHFHVWAHGSTYAPATGFDGASITGDIANGWNGSVRAFTGVDTLLDNTLVCIWTQEYYNGTEGALLAGTNDPRNVNLVGRLRREANQAQGDEQYSYLADVSFEIEGPAAQLSRLHGALITTLLNSSPTVWDEINNLTPWRVIVHLLAEHSTFLTLHDLTFDDVTTTFLYRGITTQGQNLLEVVNDAAQSINGALEFAPAGEARVVRDARYISSAARNALTTLAGLTTQDYLSLTLNVDHALTTGRIDASGGTFNSTTGDTTPFLSIAPGVAQDYPEATGILSRQILQADVAQTTAQDELNTRAGRAFAVNNELVTLSTAHPDGYAFLVPSRRLWFTWTLSTSENIRGRAYTTSTRWLLQNVSIAHDNATGTRTIQAEYIQDIDDTTLGAAGDTVTYPAQGEIALDLPGIPPFDIYPAFPDLPLWLDDSPALGDVPPLTGSGTETAPRDGNTVMIWDASHVWISSNVLLTPNPTWIEVTPVISGVTLTISHCIFDPDITAHRAYVLGNDGTNSYLCATTDIFANPPVWTVGNTLPGVYSTLRAGHQAGALAVIGEITTAGWTIVLDLAASDLSGQVLLAYETQNAAASWVAGSGYGGLGVFKTYVQPRLYGDSTTALDSVKIRGKFIDPLAPSQSNVLGVSSPGGTAYTGSGTFENEYAYVIAAPAFNPSALLLNLICQHTGLDYNSGPNHYSVFANRITLHGTGTQPTVAL